MTTKPDFQEIRELYDKYTPAQRGIVNAEEAKTIRRILELESRTPIELCNIRDMVVMLYGDWGDTAREGGNMERFDMLRDAMSAITCVIDDVKLERGMEV